jgi:hypothetical protein
MKNEKLIVEELSRIKKMMNYDTSKTNSENEIILEFDMFGLSAVVGGGLLVKYLGGKLFGAGAGAAATESAVGAAGTFLGLGPVGWTIIGVTTVAGLGVWAYTKDSDIDKVRKLFDLCKNSDDKLKWKRYMSDNDVKSKSEILFKAMDEKLFGIEIFGYGLGQTDEEAVYNVMNSFKSPGDFCAVSNYYGKTYKNTLMDDLDGDFDYGWDKIAGPLVKMIQDYTKNETEEYCKKNSEECNSKLSEACLKDDKCREEIEKKCEENPDSEVCKKNNINKSDKEIDYKNNDNDYVYGGGGKSDNKQTIFKKESDDINYKTCFDEYGLGCKDGQYSHNIKKIQKCLGLPKTGKFNKETEFALKNEFGKSKINTDDIPFLCGEF